jgi:hypothetical protein
MATSPFGLDFGVSKEAMRRKMAYAMMMQGSSGEPVKHWTQGLARALQGGMGGYELYREDQETLANEDAQTDAMIKALKRTQSQYDQPPQAPVQPPQRVPVQSQAPQRNPIVAALSPTNSASDAPQVMTPPAQKVAPSPRVWGTDEGEAAGLYPPSKPAMQAPPPQAPPLAFNDRFAALNPQANPQQAGQLAPVPVQTQRVAPQAPPPQLAQAPGGMSQQIIEMLEDKTNRQGQKIARGMGAAAIQKQLEGEKPTGDIIDYEYARRQGFTGTFEQWFERKRHGGGEYGLTPIWGTGPDGKPAFIQPGKSGKAIQGQLPEGFNIARDAIKIDAGTDWILLDPQTRQPVGKISKNIEAKQAEEARGDALGKAQVALPGAEKTSTRAFRMLDELEKHPGFSEGTGFIMGRLPALTPKAADVRERVQQVDSMVFGDAVEVMRGLGALTDKEGPKITAARARLNTAKSEDDFRTAIKDIREVFQDGIKSMRTKAGVKADDTADAATTQRVRRYNPETGKIE